MHAKYSYLIALTFILQLGCHSNGPNNPEASSTPATEAPITATLTGSFPSYPNTKYSVYLFQNGILKAALLSNNLTDSSGAINVALKQVDQNNCITNQTAALPAGVYDCHFRLDTANSATFTFPSLCPNTAGFFSNAGHGIDIRSNTTPAFNLGTVLVHYAVDFNLQSTGIISQTKNAFCRLYDQNTSLSVSHVPTNHLGFAGASISFNGGGNAATLITGVSAANYTNYFKYTCYIDVDGSSTLNTGDKYQSGTLLAASGVTISSWQTAP